MTETDETWRRRSEAARKESARRAAETRKRNREAAKGEAPG